MEAFSLLKYWRAGGNNSNGFANGRTTTTDSSSSSSSSATTTIVTTASPRSSDDDDDDGPFFDFEFTLSDETENTPEEKPIKEDKNDYSTETINVINVDDDDDDDESEYSDEEEKEEVSDHNISLSPPLPPPSDENLFFKGGLVPIEPSSLLEGNPKFPISLSKSAAKFRVLMLKFMKSKENNANDISSTAVNEKESQSRKFFAVKFVKDNRKVRKSSVTSNGDENGDKKDEDDNKFSKDVMQKYLKIVKPLHNIRVSKLRFSGQLMSLSGTAEVKGGEAAEVAEVSAGSNVKSLKQVNVATGLGLRVVCKRLGKSKSASLAAAVASPAPSASRRRDDSLLEQQDAIQSAILHCKRSFNASRDSEGSILSRSASDPSNEKSIGLSTEASCSEESKVA